MALELEDVQPIDLDELVGALQDRVAELEAREARLLASVRAIGERYKDSIAQADVRMLGAIAAAVLQVRLMVSQLDTHMAAATREAHDERAALLRALSAPREPAIERELLAAWVRLAESGRDPQPWEVTPLATRTVRYLEGGAL